MDGYFDNNATTPLSAAAREAWLREADEHWHNPSSPYRAGARVRNRLEEMRGAFAKRLGVGAEEIIFTSGATEAANAVFQYLARRSADSRVAVSAIEHPCVIEAAHLWFPDRVDELAVNSRGVLKIDPVEEALSRKPALVAAMAANNETGVLQPWREVARLCRKRGIPHLCDAVQWIGKQEIKDLSECDYFFGSAHKFGGPKGVGFLRIPPGDSGFRGNVGGGQENDHRGGTENLPSVAAMHAAFERLAPPSEEALVGRRTFLDKVKREIPEVQIVGEGAETLSNTATLLLPKFRNTRWVLKLDRLGFAVSTGSACATGKQGPSHVLAAMGVESEAAHRAIRVSGRPTTTEAEWMGLAAAFGEAWKQLQDETQSQGGSQVISI